MDILEWVWRRTAKLLLQRKVERVGVAQSENRRLQEDLIMASQYLKRAYRKCGDSVVSRACGNRTRSNSFKLKEGRFKENLWQRDVYSESRETLTGCPQTSQKPHPWKQGTLDGVLFKLIQLKMSLLYCRVSGLDDPLNVLSKPNHSMIL